MSTLTEYVVIILAAAALGTVIGDPESAVAWFQDLPKRVWDSTSHVSATWLSRRTR